MHISRRLYVNILGAVTLLWLVFLTADLQVRKRFTYDDGVLLYKICHGDLIVPNDPLLHRRTEFSKYINNIYIHGLGKPLMPDEFSLHRRLETLLFEESGNEPK